ncbi:MAG: hypothetical protein PHD06_03470 [Bacteroidales bacterium]|nr:hypothetical protein [Bacteroidales bacterium]MDD4384219.1 hypothetical protein [Bacteroidales bacterium]MDY0197510.1 hypothetical protein [Tenuifilaceae bacterium]
MFSKLKLKVGHNQLRKNLKGVKRNRLIYNLDTARTIGILFNAASDDVFNNALEFANFLNRKNLEVSAVAFYCGKETPQSYLLRKNVDLFNKKDINWYHKPQVPSVDKFIEKDFDILIDLSMKEVFPLKWIATLSRAKFKVGNLSYYGTPNDLIINLKPNDDIEYLISQITHYLQLINNRFAQNNNEQD